MAKNKRVFYASHDVSVVNSTSGESWYSSMSGSNGQPVVQGAQSVGLDTTFGGEDQLFQLGRLAAYDSNLTAPEVEITINKALDGWPLIWHHHCGYLSGNDTRLLNMINATSTIVLTVGDDTDEYIGEGGGIDALNKCEGGASIIMTGCTLNGFTYTFGDGVFTEELSFMGNSKDITDNNNGAPWSEPLGGGVLSRQNFRQATSILPDRVTGKKISQITVSGDLGSDQLFALGSFYPVMKNSPLPVNITVQFDVIADTHDCVGVAIETVDECASPTGLTGKQPIYLEFCNAAGDTVYEFEFRDSEQNPTAKLSSVSYSGGDTGGGNVIITYTYIVANIMSIIYSGTLPAEPG